MTCPIRPARRRGQALVLMVPLLFTFFAFAALIVDLGIVRTTQARMTGACDTAALETVRWRDESPRQIAPDATPRSPALRDALRRDAAVDVMNNVFSNPPADQPSAADAAGPFDAGPAFDVKVIAPNMATIRPLAGGYRPALKTNLADNASDGDVVAGTFAPLASHADGSAYDRDDLSVAAAGDASADAPAALVRLRRLRDNLGERTDDARSIGPSLPLLFGRGGLIAGDDNAAFSVRRDGFSVRAAAIATATPAVAVCPSQIVASADGNAPPITLQGGQPIALSVAFWNALPAVARDGTATPTPVVNNNGTLTGDGVVVGHLWQAAPTTAAGWTTIGQPIADVPPADPGSTVLSRVVEGFVALYEGVADGRGAQTERIVAFGYARWDPTTSAITKLAQVAFDGGAKGYVAPVNATSDLSAAWPTLATIAQPYDVQQIQLANGQSNGDAAVTLAAPAVAAREPVLAPALGRAIGD